MSHPDRSDVPRRRGPATRGSPGFRVVRGNPTDSEVAALALALAVPDESGGPREARPAWLRAARIEGRAGPRIAAPGDLRATGR